MARFGGADLSDNEVAFRFQEQWGKLFVSSCSANQIKFTIPDETLPSVAHTLNKWCVLACHDKKKFRHYHNHLGFLSFYATDTAMA